MVIESFYTFLGELVVFIAILILILFLAVLIFGVLFARRSEIKYPRFLLFILDLLYSPFKAIANLLKLDEHLIDDISIKVRDDINK